MNFWRRLVNTDENVPNALELLRCAMTIVKITDASDEAISTVLEFRDAIEQVSSKIGEFRLYYTIYSVLWFTESI